MQPSGGGGEGGDSGQGDPGAGLEVDAADAATMVGEPLEGAADLEGFGVVATASHRGMCSPLMKALNVKAPKWTLKMVRPY